jgi:hypothetical protein
MLNCQIPRRRRRSKRRKRKWNYLDHIRPMIGNASAAPIEILKNISPVPCVLHPEKMAAELFNWPQFLCLRKGNDHVEKKRHRYILSSESIITFEKKRDS